MAIYNLLGVPYIRYIRERGTAPALAERKPGMFDKEMVDAANEALEALGELWEEVAGE